MGSAGPRKTKPKQGVLSVRASLFPATLVALATLICLSSSGSGQEGARPTGVPKAPPPPPNGTNVAVIDTAYIFKNHVRFNAALKQMDQDAEEFKAWMVTRDKYFQEQNETLKQYKLGSPEFQRQEEKLASELTQNKLESHRKQQELRLKEAALYYDTYAELEKTLTLVARRNQIGIVLRYTREAMKRDDPNSVNQGLMRGVVYQYGLDISKHVLDELNAGQQMPAGQTAGKKEGPSASKQR